MPETERAARRGWKRGEQEKWSAKHPRMPGSRTTELAICRPRAFYLGNLPWKVKRGKVLSSAPAETVRQQYGTLSGGTEKSPESATYRWASHTWWPQATTSHRACCTRSAWTPQERCSQECLLWRRPETRTVHQGARGREGAQSPVLETEVPSTTYGYPKVTGQDGPVANGRPALPERFHSERQSFVREAGDLPSYSQRPWSLRTKVSS